MFVKVLLPENNPPPVLGLLMQIALSSFPASSFSVAENKRVCRNYIHILQLKVIHLDLDMSLIAYKKKTVFLEKVSGWEKWICNWYFPECSFHKQMCMWIEGWEVEGVNSKNSTKEELKYYCCCVWWLYVYTIRIYFLVGLVGSMKVRKMFSCENFLQEKLFIKCNLKDC